MSCLTSTAEGCIERMMRLLKMTKILSCVLIDVLGKVSETEGNQRFVNQLSNEFGEKLRVSNKDLCKGTDRRSESLWRRRAPTSG